MAFFIFWARGAAVAGGNPWPAAQGLGPASTT